jgi:hypothetical protein
LLPVVIGNGLECSFGSLDSDTHQVLNRRKIEKIVAIDLAHLQQGPLKQLLDVTGHERGRKSRMEHPLHALIQLLENPLTHLTDVVSSISQSNRHTLHC